MKYDLEKINDLVAEKVMGWPQGWKPGYSPTTRIGEAWDVVEKMQQKGFTLELSYCHCINPSYAVEFLVEDDPKEMCSPMVTKGEADDTSPSLAICLAALQAVGVEIPKESDENKKA